MTVMVFQSTDTNAPLLYDLTGSLTNLLTTVLVTGYNTTAWIASTVYALDSQVIPSLSAPNGYYYLATIAGTSGATAPTWPTVAGNTVVDGTVTWTCQGPVQSAGWSVPFVGAAAGEVVYQMGPGSSGRYLNVNNNSYTSQALFTGYETMTAYNTGTNPFPTTAQSTTYFIYNNYGSAAGDQSQWVITTNGKFFYLAVCYSGGPSGNWVNYGQIGFFGDFPSVSSTDAYNTVWGFSGSSIENSVLNYYGANSVTGDIYADRAYNQTSLSNKELIYAPAVPGRSGLTYPNPTDNGLYTLPLVLMDTFTTGNVVRGTLPGIWGPIHDAPLQPLQTYSGSGNQLGKTFITIKTHNTSQFMLETSNTW